jgi:peptide/nickel transport system substrate-binding protein
MKDGYAFSAGPWKLDHWTKGTELELVPNPRYWGKTANLKSVTFKFFTDPAVEQRQFAAGQVVALYPRARAGIEALKATPGTNFDAVSGLSYDAVWFNVAAAPLNSKAFRKALAYATDRDAIVSQLSAAIEPGARPIQAMFSPAVGAAYSTPFAQYARNLNMVNTLMTGDGWTKGADGVWARNGSGTRATLEVKTPNSDPHLQLIAEILQTQWQEAGFQVMVTPVKPSVLFAQVLPSGNFQVGLYPQTPADNDLGECFLWCSKNIPSVVDNTLGQNWTRIDDPNLDPSWSDAETNLDESARIADAHKGSAVLAEDVPVLPLDPWPDILVVNTEKVATQTGVFQHNLVFGPFTYLNYWFLR